MFDDQAALIEKRLADNWSATPIAWDNINYVPQRDKAWIRYQVSWSTALLISGTADNGVYRERGVIMLSVFTPRGDGPASNQDLAGSLASLFRGWYAGKLYCEAPYLVRVGEEQEWFHQNVFIPFHYDNCFKQEVV